MQRKFRFGMVSIVLLVFGLLIGPAGAQEAPESPEVAACLPGAGYASGCDVDQDGDVDINDIQLTAGRWNTSGAYTSSHTHWGETWTGTGSHGLRLENTTASGTAFGIYGKSASTSGLGVYGEASASSGQTYGVYGWSQSTGGRGVYGYASASSGETYGVYGLSDSTHGYGVRGQASSTSNVTYGVYGESASTAGIGVQGNATASSGVTRGVYGWTESTWGRGVYGYANASSGETIGVFGRTNSSSGYGVYGEVGGNGYGLYTLNDLYVGGSCSGCLMTFIARNTGPETLQVGEVTAISGVGPVLKGHTRPVLQVRKAAAGDAAVMGVVYSRGEFHAASTTQPAAGDDPTAAMGEGPEASDSVHPGAGEVAPGDYLFVAVSGMAQVRVAPGAAGLAPGVRLVMGDVPGRAQAASEGVESSMVFARALEGQPDENGLLWALITLP